VTALGADVETALEAARRASAALRWAHDTPTPTPSTAVVAGATTESQQ
jgi:hypothetical protein